METNDLDTVVVRVQNLCIDLETQEVEAVIFLCDLKNHNVVPTFYGTTQASQFARGSITQKAFLTEFLRFCEEIHSRRKRNELISASQAEPEEDMMTLDMSVEEATNEDDKNWQQEQIASDPFQVADKQPQAQQIGGKNLWEQNFNQFVQMMNNDTEKKDDNSGKKSEKLDTNYKKNLTDSEKISVSSHNVTVKREVTFEDSEQYGKLPGYSEDVSIDQNLVTEIKTEPIDPDDVSLINNEYTASHNTVTGKTNIGNRLSSSSVSVSMAANQQGVERGKSSGVTSRYAVSTSGNVRTTCGSTVLPVGTISSTVEGATNSQSVLLLVPVHATIPTQKSAVPPNSLSSIPTSSVPSIPAQISLIPMNRAPVPSPQVSLLNESASPLNAQSQKAVVESSPQSLLKRSNVTTSNDCVEPLFKQQKVTQTLQKPVSFTHTTGATEKNRRMKNIKCVAVQKPGSDESISVTQKQGSIASGSKTDVSKAAVPSEPGRGILRASKRIHDKKITYSATTAKESAKGSNSTPQKQNAKQMSRKDHQTVLNDKASTSEADDADVEEDEDDSADDEKLGIPTGESPESIGPSDREDIDHNKNSFSARHKSDKDISDSSVLEESDANYICIGKTSSDEDGIEKDSIPKNDSFAEHFIISKTKYTSSSSPKYSKLAETQNKLATNISSSKNNKSKGIYVARCAMKPDGKRYGVKHVCLFCCKQYARLPRHLVQKHAEEKDVQQALTYKINSIERKEALRRLMYKGDYAHNLKVFEEGSGEIIPGKRPPNETDVASYSQCQHCFRTYLSSEMGRHMRKVHPEVKQGTQSRGHCQKELAYLLPISIKAKQNFEEKILNKLINDSVTLIAKSDSDIVIFGQQIFFESAGIENTSNFHQIRQKMRHLAHFVQYARNIDSSIDKLRDCITPEKFQLFVRAVKHLCCFNESTQCFGMPILARELEQSLSRVARIVKNDAITKGDKTLQQKAEGFIKLYREVEFSYKALETPKLSHKALETSELSHKALETSELSHKALKTSELRRKALETSELSHKALKTSEVEENSKPAILPLAEDLMALTASLKNKAQEILSSSEITHVEHRVLSRVTLAQLVLFNLTRAKETERLLVQQYCDRIQNNENIRSEVLTSLSPLERKLAEVMHRVEVTGMQGRQVVILIPQNLKKQMDILIQNRFKDGSIHYNIYMFPGDAGAPLRAHNVLRDLANTCRTLDADTLTSTEFERHVATVFQVLNLTDNEQGVLPTFLGQHICIQGELYQLQEDKVQVARVSKFLLEMEKGNLHLYTGKSLEDIQVHTEGHVVMNQRHRASVNPFPIETRENFEEKILNQLSSDSVSLIAKSDSDILIFGNQKFLESPQNEKNFHQVRQKMRDLARFVQVARKEDPSIYTLRDCITPEKFQSFVKSLQNLCCFNKTTQRFGIQYLARHLGQSLSRVARIVKNDAITKGDKTLQEKAEGFMKLYRNDWEVEFSYKALETSEVGECSKPAILPLAEDLKTLTEYLKNKAQEILSSSEITHMEHGVLSKITLAQLVLFNMKRAEETEQLQVQQYVDNIQNSKSIQWEVMESLSPLEIKLAEMIYRVEVRGIHGRQVAVLIPQTLKEQIEILLKNRSKVGILPENLHLFARPGFTAKPPQALDVLRDFAITCNAKQPDALTSTENVKHVATMSQVLNLKDDNELDVLATFLGHHVCIQREIYQLPEDIIQVAKVSKLLLEMENGNLHLYAGKSLDEIPLDPEGNHRRCFPAKEKLHIVTFAEQHGNRAAEREFNVSESNVRNWRKIKTKLQNAPATKCSFRHTLPQYPKLERVLVKWIEKRRKNDMKTTTNEIMAKSLLIARERYGITDFKGSRSWCTRFIHRHFVSKEIQKSQTLSDDCRSETKTFHRFLTNVNKNNRFGQSQIGSVEQISFAFKRPRGTTKVQKIKCENGRSKFTFSLILACTADGSKLPPYAIFKRNSLPAEKYPDGIIVRYNATGKLDEDLARDWTKVVWKRRSGYDVKSLLIMDSNNCSSKFVKENLLQDHNTHLTIIPSGLCSTLQPLSIVVEKPMMIMVRHRYREFMSFKSDPREVNKSTENLLDQLTLPMLCQWILDAWVEIKQNDIEHSFKRFFMSVTRGYEKQNAESGLHKEHDGITFPSIEDDDDVDDGESEDVVVPQYILDIFLEDDGESEFEGFGPENC